MTCKKVQKLLMDYIEDILDEDSKDYIRAHINVCDNCRKEFKMFVTLIEGIRTQGVKDPGELYWHNFLPQLKARIEEEKREKESWLEKFGNAMTWQRLSYALLPIIIVVIIININNFIGNRKAVDFSNLYYLGGSTEVDLATELSNELLTTLSEEELNDISNILTIDVDLDGNLPLNYNESIYYDISILNNEELNVLYKELSIHDDISQVHTERQNKAERGATILSGRSDAAIYRDATTRRGSNEGMRSYDALYNIT